MRDYAEANEGVDGNDKGQNKRGGATTKERTTEKNDKRASKTTKQHANDTLRSPPTLLMHLYSLFYSSAIVVGTALTGAGDEAGSSTSPNPLLPSGVFGASKALSEYEGAVVDSEDEAGCGTDPANSG
jgi:hypothetical protein